MDAELKNCGVNCLVAGSLLCFVVALAAITPPPVLKVNIAVSDPSQKVAVISGLLAWESKLGGFQWELSRDDNAWVFRDWNKDDDLVIINGWDKLKSNQHFSAYTNSKAKLVVLKNFPGDDLVETTTHEIGHVLGVNHSQDISSVMYPITQELGTQDIRSSDLLQLNNIYHIQDNFKIFIPYQYKEFSILRNSKRGN